MLSQRGSHILEFSLVVFFLFFFIAGAFDINTALQSYTALQEGVKKSLRCSYATDSECVNPSLGTREPRYHVVRYPNPVSEYYINNFDYSGEATWFEQTDYRIRPEAVIADQMDYTFDDPIEDPQNPPPEVMAKRSGQLAYYVRTHILPEASGNELHPNFTRFEKGGLRRLNSNSNGVVTIPEYPSPFPKDAKCLDPETLNQITCDSQMRILIHVNGKTSGNGQGAVEMALYDTNDILIRDLGGRQIDGNTNYDNFALRGIYCGKNSKNNNCFYNPSLAPEDPGYKEPYLYRDIQVPFDKVTKLKFKLIKPQGSDLSWEVSEVKIFNSIYKLENPTVECLGSVPAPDIKTAPCIHNHKSGLAPTKDSLAATVYVINDKEYSPNEPLPPIERRVKNAPCGSNYGKVGMENDCRDICKFPEGIKPKSAKCSTKLLKFSEKTFSPSCAKPDFFESDVGENFTSYPLRTLNKDALPKRVVVPEGSPKELAKTAQYSCGIPVLVTRKLETETLPNTSLFVGIRPDLGCNWEEVLRLHAVNDLPQNLKISNEAHFEATRIAMNEIKVPAKPIDLCVAYRQSLKEAGDAENLGEISYSALPADCLNNKSLCKLNFIGYTEGSASTAHVDTYTAIAQHGIPVIQSSFPRANFKENCSNDYCTEIKEVQSGDENTVSYSAKMKVPLTLLKIAGMDSVDISYQDSHKLERIYSK